MKARRGIGGKGTRVKEYTKRGKGTRVKEYTKRGKRHTSQRVHKKGTHKEHTKGGKDTQVKEYNKEEPARKGASEAREKVERNKKVTE